LNCFENLKKPIVRKSGDFLVELLALVDAHASRSERHQHEQAADDGEGLEEVVLEEVVHGAGGGVLPELVLVQVEDEQPADEHHGRQLGLVAGRHADHQSGTDDVLDEIEWAEREVKQGDEHEHEQNSSAQLHVGLG